jgi:DNA-nicking Smr family endonuclease
MKLSLDLHGVRHGNVGREVDKFIGEHLMKGSNEVEIIIGNSNEMKVLVDSTLQDYGLVSEYNFLTKSKINIKLK